MRIGTFLYIAVFLTLTELSCFAGSSLPYSQDFDSTDATGWTHYALSGTDDWQRGVPNKVYNKFAYSGQNVFATGLSGWCNRSANRCLETPAFDFPDNGEYILSFYHHYDVQTSECRLEYLSDGSTEWKMLDSTKAEKYHWYNAIDPYSLDSLGFYGTSDGAYIFSSVSLGSFKGRKNVKFRFRIKTSDYNDFDGWTLDNFVIAKSFTNIKAITTNDVISRSKYDTSSIGIRAYSQYQCYLPKTFIDNIDVYLSLDSVLDAGDKFLGRQSVGYLTDPGTSFIPFYIQMPKDLYARTYYIICRHNADSSVSETDYSDNTAYVRLVIDTTFEVDNPYFESFEGDTCYWQVYNQFQTATSPNTAWHLGAANIPRTFGAHSGKKSWFTNLEGSQGTELALESPYLYFQKAPNSVICFWYRLYDIYTNAPNFSLNYTTDSKTFYYEKRQYPVNYPRNSKWDCRCQDLSVLNNTSFSKLRFDLLADPYTSGYAAYVNVDDVYIGPPAPDLLLERLYTLRTAQDVTTDTLHYRFYNAGLKSTSESKTKFYWSNDSLLDNNDILLATVDEPAMIDTAFIDEKLVFNKPANLNDGIYYILYKVDADNQVVEYNENNNSGVIKVIVSNVIKAPYFNDFESDTTGWTHEAVYSTDSWMCAIPHKDTLYKAFSGQKAYVTNPNGLAATSSRMDLISPIFDLTAMKNPVLSFDMVFQHNMQPNTIGDHANMTYTTDFGATWNSLDTTSSSYANWYYYYRYEPINGYDYPDVVSQAYFLDNPIEKCFTSYNLYGSRDERNLNRRVLDISNLKNYKHIQFRLNLAIIDTVLTEGIVFDNFSIAEKDVDLTVLNPKIFYISPMANKLRVNIDIDNIGNYISESCKIKLGLPALNDTMIPYDFPDVDLLPIIPTQRQQLTLNLDLPSYFNTHNTLEYNIDYEKKNVESNTQNNHGYLGMGFGSFKEYPYFEDFKELNLNGWTWYHDNNPSGYNFFRFRNYTTPGDAYNSMIPTGIMATDEELSDLKDVPILYLESPYFDFSILDSLKYFKFDFICIGGGDAGGTLEYSSNGGNQWQALTKAMDPKAVNWFNSPAIAGLGNEPGWCSDQGFAQFQTAQIDISPLLGQKNIKFRFKYIGNNYFWQDYHIWGMQIKNFTIDGFTIDLVAMDSFKLVTPVHYGDGFRSNFTFKNVSKKSVKAFRVKFWWSDYPALTPDSKMIFVKDMDRISADSVVSTEITFPFWIYPKQNKYYVFYQLDCDSVVVEPDKNNNLGSFVVDFTNTSVEDKKVSNDFSIILKNNSLKIINNSSINGESVLKIIDITGRTIFSTDLNINQGLNEIQINPSLSAGVYIISIENRGELVYKEKCLVE